MDSIFEMIKLLAFMLFVSSAGAQAWIAFLDIVGHFSKKLEKFRPVPSQDKYSRIVVVLGLIVWFLLKNGITFEFTN